MWNPKRLLLLIFGFVICYACYLVYGFFLGQYDGLPPLPREYQPSSLGAGTPITPKPDIPSHAVELLREAFGPNCEEQHRRIKLEWRKQGVVMAADAWKVLHNGQLRLTKVSVGMFGHAKPDAKGNARSDANGMEMRRINTVQGDQADIEFDQPLSEQSLMRDAQTRHPVAGKISGSVHLRNNRNTTNPDDDLHLYTPWLYYSDKDHRITTKADVRIVDSEAAGSSPQAVVTATGMEVMLVAEEAEPDPKNAKAKSSKDQEKKTSITGVQYVTLEKNICMDLLLDSHSTFLGGTDKATPTAGDKKSTEKSPVVINCRGPFVYTVALDPDAEPDRAEYSDMVNVIRKQIVAAAGNAPDAPPAVQYDQLDCDHLTLLFNRQPPPPPPPDKKPGPQNPAPTNDESVNLDLVKAHAIGKLVELVSDGQALHATGTEMIYDKVHDQTILKGDPVDADKDGNHIHLRGTLTLLTPQGEDKDVHDAHAEGPGDIRLKTDKPGVTRIARWNKEMIVGKDGTLDKLTFKELASFEDSEQGRLQGDLLIVWLITPDKNKPQELDVPPPIGKAAPEDGRRLRRLEATNNVALRSKDLIIHRAEQVHVQVEDGEIPTPSTPAPAPATAAAPASSGPVASIAKPPPAAPQPPGTPATMPSGPEAKLGPPPGLTRPPPPGDALAQAPRAKPPIELTARTVDVRLLSDGKKTDLKELHAEEKVVVVQKPLTPEDKPVDIRGDRLTLRHEADGNVLNVVGQPGYVQLDKITIIGPLVNIDQLQNVVTVQGSGSLKMLTSTDFEGTKLKEPSEVTVFWGQRMFFDGQLAEFDQPQLGRVQAVQENSKLACRQLQVLLDRRVSLKDRQPGQGDQPAALNRMICNENVRMEKGIKLNDKWEEYQRVEGEEALFDNPTGQLNVSGPGIVYLLRRGSQQDGLPGQGKPNANPPKKEANDREMKLTRIQFQGWMKANKINGIAHFEDGIEVFHLPAEDPDVAINVDQLPQGGMNLKSNKLTALQHKENDKVISQEFEATGRCAVKAQTYYAQSDVVKYDESKDLLIFQGAGGNLAVLHRQLVPGASPERVAAKQIQYFRAQNRVVQTQTDAIRFNQK